MIPRTAGALADAQWPPRVGFAPVTTRRMLLVHGAWQGAWSFDLWRPALAAEGWQAEAVDLPGNGCDPTDRSTPADISLQRYVDHVLGRMAQWPEPVVLVGHSGGGVTSTAVAEAAPQRVAAIVYLAGMMLPSGMGYAELVRACQADHPDLDLSGIAPWLHETADGHASVVDPQGAAVTFLHDCEPALAHRLAARLRPQPHGGRDVAPLWTPARYGRVPRIYVEARADRSLRLPVQRRMQRLVPGAFPVSLGCGHVPQVACPEESAARVCAVLVQGHAAATHPMPTTAP